jgi:hypothetical protein
MQAIAAFFAVTEISSARPSSWRKTAAALKLIDGMPSDWRRIFRQILPGREKK